MPEPLRQAAPAEAPRPRRNPNDARRLVSPDALQCQAQTAFLRAIEKYLPTKALQELHGLVDPDLWIDFHGHNEPKRWAPWRHPLRRSAYATMALLELWTKRWRIDARCVLWWAHYVSLRWAQSGCPTFPLSLTIEPDHSSLICDDRPVFPPLAIGRLPAPNPLDESRDEYTAAAAAVWEAAAGYLRTAGYRPATAAPVLEAHCEWVALKRLCELNRTQIAADQQLDVRSINNAIAEAEALIGLR